MNEKSTAAGCIFCGTPLRHTFVDLGMSPLCESYVPRERLNHMEPFYPLRVYVCEQCFLVQLEEFVSPEEIFTEYAYFSSYADSWVEHMRRYADMITEPARTSHANSFVVEVASNDGYLLQHFVRKGIPVLGIEPAANVAKVAVEKGIPTLVRFFGEALARELAARGQAGGPRLRRQRPRAGPEARRLREGPQDPPQAAGSDHHRVSRTSMQLMAQNQFDTIYHEHFSYFSFTSAEADLRGARAHALRRRGAADPRGLAAHLRPSRRGRLAAGHRAGAGAVAARARRRR